MPHALPSLTSRTGNTTHHHHEQHLRAPGPVPNMAPSYNLCNVQLRKHSGGL